MKISPMVGYSCVNNHKSIKKNASQDTLSISASSYQKPSFKSFLLDDMFFYFRRRLNEGREEARKDQIQQMWTKVTSDVAMVSDRLGIPYGDAKDRYDKYIDLGGLKANKNGNERGLNKVVGYSLEKLDLIKDVVSPMVLMLKDNSKDKDIKTYKEAIPNGLLFYGPGGTGKNYMTECFFEHLQEVAKQKDINLVTVDMKDLVNPTDDEQIIKYIRDTFENAECWDGSKHTVIFLRYFDSYIDNGSEEVIDELAFQMTGAKDKGITWMAMTNKGSNLPDWVFNPSRLGIAKPVRDISENEMSAVMSYFWAKLGRLDKSSHDQILNYCKTHGISLYPPKCLEIAKIVEANISPNDRKYSNSPDYIAPVTTEDVIAAINELMHRSGYTQEENGEVTSGMDEERLIGIKIGKYLAMMDK